MISFKSRRAFPPDVCIARPMRKPMASEAPLRKFSAGLIIIFAKYERKKISETDAK
jgi:hypothetical protein